MSIVALIRCESYQQELVTDAVQRGVDLLGGIGRFVRDRESILLKPNLLVPELPEKCVTTHPAVFQAVAQLLKQTNVTLSFGDSPAVGGCARAAKKAGLLAVADELGIEMADFKYGRTVVLEQALQNRQFIIANGALDCDGIISLPKLKTHALERLTGCVKNQFGCVPGILKGEFHVKLPDAHQFGKMLVDLNNFLKPRLYVMDGIQAMEGNGPRGGKPRQMNLLLISDDPIALDATVCRLVGIDPEIVPTTRYGAESGAGTYLESEIELVGDAIDAFIDVSFDIDRNPIKSMGAIQSRSMRWVNHRLVAKPKIDPETCTQCGSCVAMCPTQPKALSWYQEDKTRPPVYNYDLCIRCYCCQEVCPDGAIHLRTPLLRRLLDHFR